MLKWQKGLLFINSIQENKQLKITIKTKRQ